jgi:hypothetical protein
MPETFTFDTTRPGVTAGYQAPPVPLEDLHPAFGGHWGLTPEQIAARTASKSTAPQPATPSTAISRAEAVAGLAPPASVNTSPSANVADAGVTTDADAARRQAIDDVMSALIASNADLSSPTGQRDPNYIYDSGTGTVTLTDAGVVSPPGADAARVHDDGRDLQAEHSKLLKVVTDLEAKLNAGTFDPSTGQKHYDVAGQAREVLQRQIESTKASVSLSIQALNAIGAQRRADELKLLAGSNEQLARAAFANGDQSKRALLDKMIAEEEARELARSIVAARVAGRR